MRLHFLRKIKSDGDFRVKSFLICSFVLNFAYALFLFVVSQIYFSKWFFIMSIYYALLFAVRIFMFSQIVVQKTPRGQLKVMRAFGCFLFLLNVTVSVMMFLLIYTVPYVKHHEITVITLATYTFYSITLAAISSVKRLKTNDYVYFCVKILSLVSASVSMVTLTNTMLTTFGENIALLRRIILPILSGIVSIFIIACAVLMLRKANTHLRILKNEKE